MNDTHRNATAPNVADETPERLFFDDDGRTPNSAYPVLRYRGIDTHHASPAEALEQRFARNGWPPQWRGGVFDYHHYHSRAHETLGVAGGTATLVLGGENGRDIDIRAGDVLVLPAGTGHCRRRASDDFLLVAASPPDQPDPGARSRGECQFRAFFHNLAGRGGPDVGIRREAAGADMRVCWQDIPREHLGEQSILCAAG